MDEQMIEPCPFCGDPMVREAGGFGHTSDYQDALPEDRRCILRHTFYPDELFAVWNHRAAHSVIAGKVAELERELVRVQAAAFGIRAEEIDAALAPYPERRSE